MKEGINVMKRYKKDYYEIIAGERRWRAAKMAKLKEIPVIIFSSLINEDMRRKGEMLGADAQLSKSQMSEFIQAVDSFLQ